MHGGAFSLSASLVDNRIKACAICYGRVATKEAEVKTLEAAVLGVFGKEDRGIPLATVRQFEAALAKTGKTVERIDAYEAGHGFMRPKNGDKANPAYQAEEAKLAWERIEKFYAKTLKGK